MLIIVQFPIADVRGFVSDDTGRLPKPYWPIPDAGNNFIRSFGMVKSRPRGGLTGWLGESEVCDSRNAIRFRDGLGQLDGLQAQRRFKNKVSIRVVFRRWYFDGKAVGKLEIGFELFGVTRINIDLLQIVQHVLALNVTIANPLGDPIVCSLANAGKAIGNLYHVSTTQSSLGKNILEQYSYLIQTCEPVVMVELREHERQLMNTLWNMYREGGIVLKAPLRAVLLPTLLHSGLFFTDVNLVGRQVKCWLMYEPEDYDYTDLTLQHGWIELDKDALRAKNRELRLVLLRMHAERECLKWVLRLVGSGQVLVIPRTKASDQLQHYFNVAIPRILRFNENRLIFRPSSIDNLYDLSLAIYDQVLPGTRESILEALQSIRPNILAKVKNYLDYMVFEGDFIMGDVYNVGQAGAVGPNSSAHDINFNQIWLQQSGNVDLPKLASELAALRMAMKQEATTAAQDIEVAEIAQAEIEAKNGDGQKMLGHLAKAGNWALDVATKIGTSVAAEMIKKSMGL